MLDQPGQFGRRKKIFILSPKGGSQQPIHSDQKEGVIVKGHLLPKKSLPCLSKKEEEIICSIRKKKILKGISYLQKKYPYAFNADNPKPLKIGIHHDILKDKSSFQREGISTLLMRDTLRYYTKRSRYRYALDKYKDRIDLNGQIVSRVHMKIAGSSSKSS